MPPPPKIGSVRPTDAGTEDTNRGESAPPTEAEEATQKATHDDGSHDPPGSLSLPRAPRRGLVPPPPVLGPSSTSGVRAPPVLGPSSTSGLRAPSLGTAAVSHPADSAGSWPKTDGWDLDEDEAPAPLPSPASVEKAPKVTPAPARPPGSVAKPELASPAAATPAATTPAAATPAAATPAAAAPAATTTPGEPSPWLDVAPIQPTATPEQEALAQVAELLQAAPAPVAAAAAWDPPPLLDAAPQAEGGTDGVPLLDSAGLMGTAIVEEVDGGSSVPRLPLPGMMRDGPAPRAADFRASPRASRAPTAGAMAPLPGMVPPSFRERDEAPRISSDTASFVAQVADELVESGQTPATAELAGEEVVTEVGAPPPKLPPLELFTSAQQAPGETQSKLRGPWLAVAGLAAGIVLIVWLSMRGDGGPPEVAAAPAASTPVAEPAPAKAPVEAKAPTELAAVVPAVGEEEPDEEEPDEEEPDEAEGSTGAGAALEADDAQADPEAEDGAEVEAAAEPTTARKSSGKSRGSKSSSNGGSSKEEPASEPKAASNDEPTAKSLLKQARSAYAAGKGSWAYSLAAKSNRMEATGDAAEVMTLAACLMNDPDKAKSALRAVPLLRRGSVRSTCKSKHDVRIGL